MFKVQWSYFRVWISKLTVQTSKFRAFWTDLKYLRPFHTSSNGKNSWCWCVFQLQHVSKLWIQIITLYICVFLVHTEWMFDHFHAIDIVKTRRIAFQSWKVTFSAVHYMSILFKRSCLETNRGSLIFIGLLRHHHVLSFASK